MSSKSGNPAEIETAPQTGGQGSAQPARAVEEYELYKHITKIDIRDYEDLRQGFSLLFVFDEKYYISLFWDDIKHIKEAKEMKKSLAEDKKHEMTMGWNPFLPAEKVFMISDKTQTLLKKLMDTYAIKEMLTNEYMKQRDRADNIKDKKHALFESEHRYLVSLLKNIEAMVFTASENEKVEAFDDIRINLIRRILKVFREKYPANRHYGFDMEKYLDFDMYVNLRMKDGSEKSGRIEGIGNGAGIVHLREIKDGKEKCYTEKISLNDVEKIKITEWEYNPDMFGHFDYAFAEWDKKISEIEHQND